MPHELTTKCLGRCKPKCSNEEYVLSTGSCSVPGFFVCCRKPGNGCLHVTFSDIFVTQTWSANGPATRSQLPIEHLLGDPAIFHSLGVTKPAQMSLRQKCKHAGNVAWESTSLFETLPCCEVTQSFLTQHMWKVLCRHSWQL